MNNTDDLFASPEPAIDSSRPLADRMRPGTLDDFFGQRHILGPDKPLRTAIESQQLHSMIFWGPPGTGKTTLARIIANNCNAQFLSLSAVLSGVKDIRAAIEKAQQARGSYGQDTVLFVDEVHRFNKSQQDAFLPYVENGTVTFIGATTENPSFELNNALLSRARVYVLRALDEESIIEILSHALTEKGRGLGDQDISIEDEQLAILANNADGDARRALNLLEICSDLADEKNISNFSSQTTHSPSQTKRQITADLIKEVVTGGVRRFDKGGEAFYDQISALHKSVRGSNPDAALYWMARMLDGGCDPLYVARRVVRMASEDIGNADPRGLQLSLNAWDVQQRLGSPEGELAIAQAVVYLACTAKSNAVYNAYNAAMQDAKNSDSLEVPLHLRNAPTQLMKDLDYGKDYRYAHDEPDAYAAGEQYFPEQLQDRIYYDPVDRGLEQKIRERLHDLRKVDSIQRQPKAEKTNA